MIKKNDLFEAEITAMTAEGSGICRADGMAVFVPFAAPGDVVILCPACAAFDKFPNFMVRGKTFKEYVNALPE